jgi:hypothetical protein
MFRWGARSIQAGPSVQWNILNYGQITNNVRAQDAAFQQLVIAYRTRCSRPSGTSRTTCRLPPLTGPSELLAQSVTSAKKALDIAVIQYREGITDFTTVLTAQNTLLAQQDSLASTLGNISTSLVGIYRALAAAGRSGRARTWCLRHQGRDGTAHELGRIARPRDLQSAGHPSTAVHSSAPRLVIPTSSRNHTHLGLDRDIRAHRNPGGLQRHTEAAAAACRQSDGRPAAAADGDDYLELTGNTQAIYTVQLVARVAGYLEQVLFQDGQIVKKGQPLFIIPAQLRTRTTCGKPKPPSRSSGRSFCSPNPSTPASRT